MLGESGVIDRDLGTRQIPNPRFASAVFGSLFGGLLGAAENGRLPDSIIRFGIRRLLKNRLRELEGQSADDSRDEILRSVRSEPIAVVPQKANEQHYEVPAEFFRKVLGSRLKYSCGYWASGVVSLDAAEQEALEVTCTNAGLADGMDILELGCGWGSLSLWMAENYPHSRITSISNSHSQREHIEAQSRGRGLSNLRVVTADINDFQTDACFDRVVSVEMFEHMRNHRELLRRIDGWLRPAGKLFVHIFCHRSTPYLFATESDADWMGRHFFTGGMMPSVDLLVQSSDALQLSNQWDWNGGHYAKTCRAWLNNQDAAAEDLHNVMVRTYGKEHAVRWHHRWRIFFMACEELFAFNGGSEWFVTHLLFESRNQPGMRDTSV